MARQGDRPEGSQAFPHSPHLPPSFFPSSVALPRTAFGTSLLVLLVSNLAVPIPGIMREKTADFGVAQEQMGHLAEEPVSFSRWLARLGWPAFLPDCPLPLAARSTPAGGTGPTALPLWCLSAMTSTPSVMTSPWPNRFPGAHG